MHTVSNEEKMYNEVGRMVAELHNMERGYWRQPWVNDLTTDDAVAVHEQLKDAMYHVSQLRNAINHCTLAGEPEELELEDDDGEQHLRNMEAFAAGGMTAVNESMGYHVGPPHYDPDY